MTTETPNYRDGMVAGIHHRVAVRAPDEDQPESGEAMRFVASTDHLDRYSTIVEQDWLEQGRMQDFARNPVALWAHNYDEHPVGRVVGWEVVDRPDGHRALMLDIKWDEGSERGREVARQYREGFLHAVSVGWQHGEIVPLRSLEEDDPRRREHGWLLRGNMLWEVSAVPVPGNAQAVKARSLAEALEQTAPDSIREEVGRYLRSDEGRGLLRGLLDPEPKPKGKERSGLGLLLDITE